MNTLYNIISCELGFIWLILVDFSFMFKVLFD